MEQAQRHRILIVHSGSDDHIAARDRALLQRRWPVETVGFARLSDLPRLRERGLPEVVLSVDEEVLRRMRAD